MAPRRQRCPVRGNTHVAITCNRHRRTLRWCRGPTGSWLPFHCRGLPPGRPGRHNLAHPGRCTATGASALSERKFRATSRAIGDRLTGATGPPAVQPLIRGVALAASDDRPPRGGQRKIGGVGRGVPVAPPGLLVTSNRIIAATEAEIGRIIGTMTTD